MDANQNEFTKQSEIQDEPVQIYVKSLGRAIEFKVKDSDFCHKCNGTGESAKQKKPCPYCCGSGRVKKLDCIRCNGTKLLNGSACNICKGQGILTEVQTREFLGAREFCEKFQKNPAPTLLLGAGCIAAAGICARIVTGILFVDFGLGKTWPSYIGLLVGILAVLYIFTSVNKMMKGSFLPATTKGAIATVVIAALAAAIFIAGPMTGKYSWIEKQAKDIIDEHFASQSISCKSFKVMENYKDNYHGVAVLSNGDTIEMVVTYERINRVGRNISYSIQVIPVQPEPEPGVISIPVDSTDESSTDEE